LSFQCSFHSFYLEKPSIANAGLFFYVDKLPIGEKRANSPGERIHNLFAECPISPHSGNQGVALFILQSRQLHVKSMFYYLASRLQYGLSNGARDAMPKETVKEKNNGS
jgi:hypothetical protein